MQNSEVAQVLSEHADILELTGGNPFKVRAYRQAALVVETLAEPVLEHVQAGTLEDVPGIGERIAAKIAELVHTGHCRELERVADKVPAGVLELLRVEGVGPKTTALAWKKLHVETLDELERAAQDGRLENLPRMGAQRVKGILEAIQRHRKRTGRVLLHRALPLAEAIVAQLRQRPDVLRAEIAGSLRRRKETIGDIDLLVASHHPDRVIGAFAHLPDVSQVIGQGPTKCSVRLRNGMQADLRVLEPATFGAAWQYFTGSKAHSIGLRTRAVRLGLKVSEYGIFDADGRRIGGLHEEDVYRAVGLPWIPPELREGTGELEAAEKGELPQLVEEDDLLGDLHVHSDASSDAHSSLEELFVEGKRLGRHYLAITDHTRSRPLGLDAQATLANAAAVREFRREHRSAPHLMTGAEVDILPDGSLDLPVDVLAQLDWVVASIHSHFRDSREQLTVRMLRAIRSGVVDVIGHPTGRLLGQRDAYELDFDRVLEAAREAGVALEINAQPDRLDLNDRLCRAARDAGVKVAISSDAHLANQLGNLRFGVWVARRGWLTRKDVINASDLPWRHRQRVPTRRVREHAKR